MAATKEEIIEALKEMTLLEASELVTMIEEPGADKKLLYDLATIPFDTDNLRALDLSRENAEKNRADVICAESDGFSAFSGKIFDAVITNPPIRAGKQVIYRMFADAADHLAPGGALYLVIRKQQGAESCVRYLQTIYSEVEKLDRSGGFWVIRTSGKISG